MYRCRSSTYWRHGFFVASRLNVMNKLVTKVGWLWRHWLLWRHQQLSNVRLRCLRHPAFVSYDRVYGVSISYVRLTNSYIGLINYCVELTNSYIGRSNRYVRLTNSYVRLTNSCAGLNISYVWLTNSYIRFHDSYVGDKYPKFRTFLSAFMLY